jgi:hypothetical protein
MHEVSREQPPRPVTFRVPGLALFVAAAPAAPGLWLVNLAGHLHSRLIGSTGLYLCFMAVLMLAFAGALRVRLDPAGIRIRTVARSQLVSWPEIRTITVEPQLRGGRRVVVWTTFGVRVPLPVPMVTSANYNEAAFLRGYHQIGQYWLAHRPVQPVAPVQPAYPSAAGWWVR